MAAKDRGDMTLMPFSCKAQTYCGDGRLQKDRGEECDPGGGDYTSCPVKDGIKGYCSPTTCTCIYRQGLTCQCPLEEGETAGEDNCIDKTVAECGNNYCTVRLPDSGYKTKQCGMQ